MNKKYKFWEKKSNFPDDYPALHQFISANFPLEEFGYESLDELMIGVVTEAYRPILNEGLRVLNDDPFPLRGICRSSLYRFTSEAEAKSWLREVIAVLEREINNDLEENF